MALTLPSSHISVTTNENAKETARCKQVFIVNQTSKHSLTVNDFGVEKLLAVAGCSF